MFKFHFSYKDPNVIDRFFLRGHNVYLSKDDIIKAIEQFREDKPDCEIEGILKTKIEEK